MAAGFQRDEQLSPLRLAFCGGNGVDFRVRSAELFVEAVRDQAPVVVDNDGTDSRVGFDATYALFSDLQRMLHDAGVVGELVVVGKRHDNKTNVETKL